MTLLVIQRVFNWMGICMPEWRYPSIVYGCVPVGGARPRGRPKGTFRHTYRWMLDQVLVEGVSVVADDFLADMEERAHTEAAWQQLVKGMSLKPKDIPTPPTRRSARLQAMHHAS